MLVLVLLGGSGYLASMASQADAASTFGHLCINYGNGECASLPAGGTAFGGEKVQFVSIGGAWRWNFNRTSDVSSANHFPFNTQWLNTAYNGKPVYQLQLHADGTYCMANDSDNVVIRVCAPTNAQTWVNSGGWFINVAASDNHNARYILSYNGNPGNFVTDEHAGDFNAALQNWGTNP